MNEVHGMKLFPRLPQVSFGAAVEAKGAEFFSLPYLGTCIPNSNVPILQPQPVSSSGPGTFDLAFTPDGSYAFIANEDGLWNAMHVDPGHAWSGTIGVVKIQRGLFGEFKTGTRQKMVNNSPYYITVKGASTMPSLTVSHDGKGLYVVHEVAESGYENPSDLLPPSPLLRSDCVQGTGPQWPNGLLTVIDVDKAMQGQVQTVMATIASACSPTRVVETSDGRYIWVAARGSDSVLAFDVGQLLLNRNTALVGVWASGGTSPVGLALFHDDQLLAVANSNRFTDGTGGTTNVTILDVSDFSAVKPALTIPSEDIHSFPRGVTLGPDGSTLYVANFGCTPGSNPPCTPALPGKLQVITTTVK
jgi:DNA-binding beta-propeller fold protein YncE